jgi:hypothetical protein
MTAAIKDDAKYHHHHSEAKNTWTGLPYLNEAAARGLKAYRYSGGDNGITYKWFFNPLAVKLVSLLPEYIA